MLGLLMLSLIKGMFLERELQANASYIVELSSNVLPGQRITAESLLKDMDGVVASSVIYISKTEALETMMEDYPGLASSEWENPFREILTFRTVSVGTKELEVLKNKVEKIPGVSAMYFESDV